MTKLSASVLTLALFVLTISPSVYSQEFSNNVSSSKFANSSSPVNQNGLRVMPVGDSITKGTIGSEDTTGYRKELYRLLVNAGYNPTFVGDSGKAPYQGHFRGGAKIEQFFPKGCNHNGGLCIGPALDQHRPDMVLIHLGTNDLYDDLSRPAVPYDNDGQKTHTGEMADFINYLLQWNNGDQDIFLKYIVVCQIIPFQKNGITGGDSLVVPFNLEINRMVEDFRSGVITGHPETAVYYCDQYTPFKENRFIFGGNLSKKYMKDSKHPNQTGYKRMADTYFETIQTILGDAPQRMFTDISWESNTQGMALDQYLFGSRGIAIADASSNGFEDIYVSTFADNVLVSREYYYLGGSNTIFDEKAETSGVKDNGFSRGVLFVDYDADGDYDIFNAHSENDVAGGERNRLYRNSGAGVFDDVTVAAGLGVIERNSTGLLALDIEGDGDLDLYAANSRQKNELYVNNGKGVFTLEDRGADDRIEDYVATESVTAADFDNDGDIDIYIPKREGTNRLFVNDGSGHFADRASQAGVDVSSKSYSASFADYDNDGDLDLFIAIVTNTDPHLHILSNSGDGTFTQDTRQHIAIDDGYSFLLSDFDNDTFLDLIVTSEWGMSSLYMNDGTGRFVFENNSGAEISRGKEYGGGVRSIAGGDFDNDGDVDVFATRDIVFNVLLRNNNHNGNNFLKVKAFGPDGHVGGFGTKIMVFKSGRCGDLTALLGVREVMAGDGLLVQNSPIQHFGLGANDAVDIIARFTDGTILVKRGIAANQLITVRPQKPVVGTPAALQYVSGDGQQGKVDTDLEMPLTVRVVDENDQPVSGVNVPFEITQGSARLLLGGFPANGQIWKELEATVLQGGVETSFDSTASGGVIGFVPPFNPQTSGTAQFSFSVDQAETYYLWMRVAAPNDNANVSVKLDNSTSINWLPSQNNELQWQQVILLSGLPWQYQLHAGSHTIQLEFQKGGAQIDKVLLTTAPDYVPTGLGGSSSSDPELTDDMGLAKRRLHLDTQVGPVQVEARLEGIGASVVFDSLMALPAEPYRMQATSQDTIRGIFGGEAVPVGVAIEDSFGNAISGLDVLFSVELGEGTVSPTQVVSDDSGKAQTQWTLGFASRFQRLIADAQVPEGSPYPFIAYAEGVADSMVYVSGNDQTADSVMQPLPDSLKVKIVTNTGLPVEDYEVRFEVIRGGGKLNFDGGSIAGDSVVSVLSDRRGICAVRWTMGTVAGWQQVRASDTGLKGGPIDFYAFAPPGVPKYLIYVSGNDQVDTVGTALENPFVVGVRDKYNNAVSGHQVTFEPFTGTGRLDRRQSITDSLGNASAILTLGSVAGIENNIVRAAAIFNGNLLEGSPVEFKASALADVPDSIARISSDSLEGIVGTQLSEPFRIKISDRFGNGVPNVAVVFRVTNGGGNIQGDVTKEVSTNEQGGAEIILTLGPKAGKLNNIVEFRLVDYPELVGRFHATARPADPYRLVEVSGNGGVAQVNQQLPDPLIVRVVDAYENSIAEHQVNFTVANGKGHFQENQQELAVASNDSGFAQVSFTLGTSVEDTNLVLASSSFNATPLVDSPVRFIAYGTSGPPDSLFKLSGDGQIGVAGQQLQDDLIVKVIDSFANPVFNAKVEFRIKLGGGLFLPQQSPFVVVNTDSAGTARIGWQVGNAGINAVEAKSSYQYQELKGSPVRFEAIVSEAGRASDLTKVSGDSVIGSVGERLQQPFGVLVTNLEGFAVPAHPVRFKVVAGGGSFNTSADTTVLSGEDGVALIYMTLGAVPGEFNNIVEATSTRDGVNPLIGSPITFVASAVDSRARQIGRFSGNNQVANVGTYVPDSLAVFVSDSIGQPVSDYPIIFSSTQMAFEIQDSLEYSNDDGIASCRILMGTQEGEWAVKATAYSQNKLSTSFSIRARDWSPAVIQNVGETVQVDTIGNVLGEPFTVRVEDEGGLPVFRVPVNFESTNPLKATVATTVDTTDNYGLAQTIVRLGTQAGSCTIYASVDGIASHDSMVVTGLGLHPVGIATVSGDHQSDTVGTVLSQPLVVEVTDAEGNGAANVAVVFAVKTGDGTFVETGGPVQQVITAGNGQCQVRFRLGTRSGSNWVDAICPSINDSVRFVLSGLADVATIQMAYSSQQFVGVARHILNQPLQVITTDRYGNGVADVRVTFYPLGNGGKVINGQPAVTDSVGVAQAQWILGPESGEQNVLAISQGLSGSPTPFQATALLDHSPTLLVENYHEVYPGNELCFNISGGDQDGDPITFGARNIPYGAVYDSTETQQFCWTPTCDQSGVHDLLFWVEDSTGRKTERQVTVTVFTCSGIELETFSGRAEPYSGVRLLWETSTERNNTGFYVLYSKKFEGPFARISELIPSNPNHKYEYIDTRAEAVNIGFYQLEDVQSNGYVTQHQILEVTAPLPEDFSLLQNIPNPFNPLTHIRFQLPKATHVRLTVYDLLGRVVSEILDDDYRAGYHQTVWNGLNDAGVRVSSGIYYYVLVTDTQRLVKKMCMLR